MTAAQRSDRQEMLTGAICHVAEPCYCYPGEVVTFYTWVDLREPLDEARLDVTLPEGLILEERGTSAEQAMTGPWITSEGRAIHLVWDVSRDAGSDDHFSVQVQGRAVPTHQDRVLVSHAVLSTGLGASRLVRARETAAVAVSARGRYLKYLPAIYEEDELMGRFLMLFESFWAPIEAQVGSLPLYVDARMTPSEFLPWLASWFDLVLDDHLPEAQRRELVRAAVSLYRKRGTRQGLEEYLELYTGRRPEIIEHRGQDLRLGPEARLGPGIALGARNLPHTFTVILHLPPASVLTRRKIESVIESQKPAHTAYNLRLEIEPQVASPETSERS